MCVCVFRIRSFKRKLFIYKEGCKLKDTHTKSVIEWCFRVYRKLKSTLHVKNNIVVAELCIITQQPNELSSLSLYYLYYI